MKNPEFGIHVYNPPGLNMNSAREAAAVGNLSVLSLGALLWWKHELTKDFCQLLSVLFQAWISQCDKISFFCQMHFIRVTFALV